MLVKRKIRPFGDVDVTSFSDLAFLLIIFFILTTTFVQPMGSRLTIPAGTSDPNQKSQKETPTINLSEDKILFEKDEISMAQLRAKLQGMNLREQKEEARVVVLDCSQDVRFDRYFQVVAAVSQAGGILALVEAEEGGKDAGKTAGNDKKTEAGNEVKTGP